MIRLSTPISEAEARRLKVGDEVLLSGRIVLSRDLGHKYMKEQKPEWLRPLLDEAVIYHCGPVIVKHNGSWKVTAAGPTTSSREEPYEAALIERFKLKAIIGKGGMGQATADACKQFGCVYLHAVGGAAQVLAQCVKAVENVFYYDEFGAPEAIWQFQVVDFPAVVTMDAHGNSLHRDVLTASTEIFKQLMNLKEDER